MPCIQLKCNCNVAQTLHIEKNNYQVTAKIKLSRFADKVSLLFATYAEQLGLTKSSWKVECDLFILFTFPPSLPSYRRATKFLAR